MLRVERRTGRGQVTQGRLLTTTPFSEPNKVRDEVFVKRAVLSSISVYWGATSTPHCPKASQPQANTSPDAELIKDGRKSENICD
jgi:hypothetical protein